MFWTDIIMGVILMITGLLVDRFPMMISGINTMSKERLAKVDLDGLKHVMRNALLIGGAVILLLGGLSTLVHIPEGIHFALLMVVVIAMVVVASLLSRRYDAGLQGEEGKKERRKGRIVLGVVIMFLVASLGLYFFSSEPAAIEVSEDGISAKSSLYKATIPESEIAEIAIMTDWPKATRTNGVGTEKVGIGHFRLENGEKCMFFLCANGGPVLEVRTVDGKLYYLNCATKEETLEMIEKVKQIMDARRGMVGMAPCPAAQCQKGG